MSRRGQLASIAAGSVAPLIATALLVSYGSSIPISIYVAACAVITIIAVAFARETAKVELTAVEAIGETLAKQGRSPRVRAPFSCAKK